VCHLTPSALVDLQLAALSPNVNLGGAYTIGLLFLGCALLVGIASLTRQRMRPYSATVVYLLLGCLASVGIGVLGVPRPSPVSNHVLFERVTELALTVAVFGAGLAVEQPISRYSKWLIAALLAVVMPLSIAAIALFGAWAMGLSLGAAVLLGAVLAPTDPVLAGDLGLGPPGSETQGEPRLSLHTEAGANDGLASPFVLIGLLIATRGGTGWIGHWILVDVLYQLGIALIIGIGGGWILAACVTRLRARELLSPEFDGFLAPALSLIIYGAAQSLGSYGLIAAFLAGIAFRRYEFDHEIHLHIHRGSEMTGRLLEMIVLLLLGSALTTNGLQTPGVAGWLLALLIIFVLRPLLVVAVTHRAPLDLRARIFLGFFGVRGVAALYYAAIVVGTAGLPTEASRTIVWTTIVCVALSVVIHGITATPLSKRLLSASDERPSA
jgi:sodium/hydrogen antiporter